MASSNVVTSDIVPKMPILLSLSEDDISNSPTFENVVPAVTFVGGPSIVGSKLGPRGNTSNVQVKTATFYRIRINCNLSNSQ